ncbi:MAG: hypothetical protein OXH90_03535 [Paracoccaceae bacterium]|nr:hypothetical protein [Paracoccaceae bacterium]MDE2916902.1 hypothetical protein [Paracoccaceae bacterium]
MEKSQEVVWLLVEAGIDPTIKGEDGVSPLSLVAGYRMPYIKLASVPNFSINNDDETSFRLSFTDITYAIPGYGKDNS